MGKLWYPGDERKSRLYNNKRKSGGPNPVSGRRIQKFIWQFLFSILIFFLVWGAFQFNAPYMVSGQEKIRSWFTEDYDIQPVLKLFSDIGIWGDTFDRAAFNMGRNPVDNLFLTVPVSGQITKPFGWLVQTDNSQIFHDGIMVAAAEGTPIRAALSGKVTLIGYDEEWGRVIEISNENGLITKYAHCQEILVKIDEEIEAGDIIGKVGKTGSIDYAQLYFSIIYQDEALNPADFFLPASKT